MPYESRDRVSSVDADKTSPETVDDASLEKGSVLVQPDPVPDGGWRAWSVVFGMSAFPFYTLVRGCYNSPTHITDGSCNLLLSGWCSEPPG